MSNGRYYAGRKVTMNGFTMASDFNGNFVKFTTKSGNQEPVMIGVTEFGVPGIQEFKRGENHMQTQKVGARFILWLPNADGYNKGVTLDGEMYRECQNDPNKYPDRLKILNEYGIPLTINCN